MEHMQSTFIDLYAGDGVRAWDRLNEWWPELRASHLLRLEQMRIQMFHLRAAVRIQAALASRSDQLLESARRGCSQDREGARALGGARGADDSCGACCAPRRSEGGGRPARSRRRPIRGPGSRPVCASGALAAGAPAWRSMRAARLTAAADRRWRRKESRIQHRWVDLHLPGFPSSDTDCDAHEPITTGQEESPSSAAASALSPLPLR